MGNSSSSSSRSGGRPNPRALVQNGSSRFRAIADNFTDISQVQDALRKEGLESSNLIVAVDFTKSNEWTGRHSFGGKCLHHLSNQPNPYEQAISVIGRTLSAFDDDNLFNAYGFGDGTTNDSKVFSFFPGDAQCQGLDAVLQRYRELVPAVKLSGPTSFAPAIHQAMKVVADAGNQYHILLLIADGQVTRPSDMPHGELSSQEQATIRAIVQASELPLSIVMVGVGDGPWDVMREFDDALPQRRFDNFQFVNFTEIIQQHGNDTSRAEALFALRALMEIPEQFKLIQRLGMLGQRRAVHMSHRPLDPPMPRAPPPLGMAPAPAQPYPQYPQSSQQYPSMNAAPLEPLQAPAAGAGRAPSSCGGSEGGAGRGPPSPIGRSVSRIGGGDPMFLCPITQEIMSDPVIAADGYSYEREAISRWLAAHDTSPMTNQTMPHKNLIPNYALRSSIMEWQQRTMGR